MQLIINQAVKRTVAVQFRSFASQMSLPLGTEQFKQALTACAQEFLMQLKQTHLPRRPNTGNTTGFICTETSSGGVRYPVCMCMK